MRVLRSLHRIPMQVLRFIRFWRRRRMINPTRTKCFLLLRGLDRDAAAAMLWILRFRVFGHDQLKVIWFDASTYQSPALARRVSEAPANAANVATLTLAEPVLSNPVAVMV